MQLRGQLLNDHSVFYAASKPLFHHSWLLQGELRLLQSQPAATGIPAYCHGRREDESSKTTHDRQACRALIVLKSRQPFTQMGNDILSQVLLQAKDVVSNV